MSNTAKLRGKNWFYFIVITLLFVFTVGRFNNYLTVNSFVMYPLTAVLSVVGVSDTLITGIRRLKAAKLKNNA